MRPDEGIGTDVPLDTHERAARAAAVTPAPTLAPVPVAAPTPISDTPPGAAEQGTTTVGDVFAPEAIRGRERMGSGGAFFDTSAALRDWLNANGVDQSAAGAFGSIRIGDLVGPPSRFGLPDRAPVELFGPRGEIAGTSIEGLVKERYDAFLRAQSDAAFAQQRAEERSRAVPPVMAPVISTSGRGGGGRVAPVGGQFDRAVEGAKSLLPPGSRAVLETVAPPVIEKVMGALDLVEKPWRSFLGRMLVTTGVIGGEVQPGDFENLVARRLTARGIVDPTYFDTANEAGELAAEIFSIASANGPPVVGGLAQAANPAWWVAAPAAATKLSVTLLNAGVSKQTAGFVHSLILNGGLPYADRALNALFINGATRAIARRAGESVGDITAAIRTAMPDNMVQFHTDEAGTLSVEQMREMLGLGRKAPSPRTVMAQLRAIARENDDPSLRESILGPGGGLSRVASSGGRDRGSLGMASQASGRGGEGLVVGQGSSAVESAELRAHRQRYVEPYKSIADEFDDVADKIDGIDKSEALRWGSLTPEEQFRQLAIEDDRWTPWLRAYQDAPDVQTRDEIVREAQKLADAMQQEKGVPFGDWDAQKYPGRTATPLLAQKAVLEARARALWDQANDLLQNVQRPTAVPKVHTVIQRSARAFDVLTPDGRKIGTERTLKGAQQRAHDLDLTQQQATLPGTPEAQAPSLKLEAQDVPVGPAGEQVEWPTRADAAAYLSSPASKKAGRAVARRGVERQREQAGLEVIEGGQPDMHGLPPEVNAETLSQRIGRPETAAQAIPRYQVLATGKTVRLIDLEQNIVLKEVPRERLGKLRDEAASLNQFGPRGPHGETERATELLSAKRETPEVAASPAAPAAARAAPRFEVREGQIFDTKTGTVDTILTGRVNEKPHANAEARDAQMARWAGWANRRVDAGDWREHQPIVPPGQKLVPEETEILPPGMEAQPKGGQPPAEPPGKPPIADDLFPPDLPPDDEGPGSVIWRVVDRGDGSFGLGRLDLERGLSIGGERFTSREGALITAEARNAAEDAVTMVTDAMESLRSLIDDAPQPALMSPGQAKAVNAALRTERQAAEKEVARARAEYLRAAQARGRVIERQGAARELYAAREHARGLTAEARRVHGVPTRTGTAEERSIIADRVQTQLLNASNAGPPAPPPPGISGDPTQGAFTFEKPGAVVARAAGEMLGSIPGNLATTSRMAGTAFDLGTSFRQLRIYAAAHPNTWQHGFRSGAQSYWAPDVVESRVKAIWKDVARYSTGELHYRGATEFTGEAISQGRVARALGEFEPIARSNAAFNNSINHVNGEIFVSKMRGVEAAVAKGRRPPPTTAEIKRLEWVLNKASGRGYDPEDLTGGLRVLHEWASLMYSPQWQASRFGMYGELKTTLYNLVKTRGGLPGGRRLDIADEEVLRLALAELGSDALMLYGASRLTGADIETDPHHTNFARVPLGDARPELTPWVAAFSALGVSAQTYNDGTVWLDFTAGLGADLRLMAQLFPAGGDYGFLGTPLGSGRAISASGREIDPWNPQEFDDRNIASVLSQWFTSRGDPRTRMAMSLIGARGGQDPGLGERALSAIVSAYTPMLLQDAIEASGSMPSLEWERWLEDIQESGHWFSQPSQTPQPRATIPPTGTARPGGFWQQYGR